MTINFNQWHPMPRYGLAAAVYAYERSNNGTFPSLAIEDLPALAKLAMDKSKRGYLLQAVPKGGTETDKAVYNDFNEVEKLKPGKASRQDSAHGFFLAPHVLTSNDSAKLLGEFAGLQKTMTKDPTKNYQLKRSFSPMTSKTNAGRGSMSDPKDDVLEAAFTAVASATPHKAAALDFDNFTNIGLIPDIPFVDETDNTFPLLEYIRLLGYIQNDLGEARVGKYDPDKAKYIGRPSLYRGNFQYALSNVNFGSLQLLAALSRVMEEGRIIAPDRVKAVVQYLENRPIHIVGYDSASQEQFGTHLTDLTENGRLYRMLADVWKVEFYDVDNKDKYGSPQWKHLKRNLNRWLRRFDSASFRGFLSIRAVYPTTFLYPLKTYFMRQQISEEIVDSALALGKSINRAAYRSAVDKTDADKVTGRSVYEYKARVLASLESNIRSAREPEQLLAQVSTLVARMTNSDLSKDSEKFMRALLLEEIELKQGQDLLVAFMRLNQSKPKAEEQSADAATEEEEVHPT